MAREIATASKYAISKDIQMLLEFHFMWHTFPCVVEYSIFRRIAKIFNIATTAPIIGGKTFKKAVGLPK